jgi:hypothetical protein
MGRRSASSASATWRRAAGERGGPASIGGAAAGLWERFAAAEPGADFTRIFPFVEGSP